MMLRSLLVAIAVLTALVAGVVLVVGGHRVVLVAKGEVAVDSYPVPGPVPVTRLTAGQRAIVLGCDDLKSYPAIHVRLPDGTEGYVIDGTYELDSVPIWSRSNDSPVTFFCP
jgi:hypothetical protein